MNKYRVLFIDEQKDEHEKFLNFVEKNKINDIEPLIETPEPSINEMIEKILILNPDAIITDFNLNEYKTLVKHNVAYDGVELIEEFLKIREAFPCFVITSYDGDAINETHDVNLVYVKNEFNRKQGESISILDRVLHQIKKYQNRIEVASARLKELAEKRRLKELSLLEEEELISLDEFLEKSIDNYKKLPSDFKKISNQAHINKLIEKVDKLMEKIQYEKV